MAGEMIWLNRQQLATLFGRDYKTISKHINNALKEELADEVVVAKFANTTQHGAIEGKTQTHEKEYFNLEMVASVGYTLHSFIHLFKYSIRTGRFLKMNGSGWG